MIVVIVGAKERDMPEDKQLVQKLLSMCVEKYGQCMFASLHTPLGVGLFMRELCLEKDQAGAYKYQLVDVSARVFAKNLSHAESVKIYLARNATLLELADVLVYLANDERRGTLEDLVARASLASRPHVVLLPGEAPRLP